MERTLSGEERYARWFAPDPPATVILKFTIYMVRIVMLFLGSLATGIMAKHRNKLK